MDQRSHPDDGRHGHGRDRNAKQVGAGKAGPITRKMQELYFGLFSGKTEDRWNWLDPVA